MTSLLGMVLSVQTAFAHEAPTVAPVRLDFDATQAPKDCNDVDAFVTILTNWVSEGALRSDAERRLVVRIRRSPTGVKLVDVALANAVGTTLAEHHERFVKTECHKVLYDSAHAAAKLMGAFEEPPAAEPLSCPACPPSPAPAEPVCFPVPTLPTPPPPPGAQDSGEFGTQRTIGVVVAGVGLAGLIVGSVFGGQTLAKVNEANEQCDGGDPPKCSKQGIELHQQANTLANISNVGIGVGAAAIVGGIVLIAVAPKGAPKTSSAWRMTPVVAPGWASLSLTGAF